MILEVRSKPSYSVILWFCDSPQLKILYDYMIFTYPQHPQSKTLLSAVTHHLLHLSKVFLCLYHPEYKLFFCIFYVFFCTFFYTLWPCRNVKLELHMWRYASWKLFTQAGSQAVKPGMKIVCNLFQQFLKFPLSKWDYFSAERLPSSTSPRNQCN